MGCQIYQGQQIVTSMILPKFCTSTNQAHLLQDKYISSSLGKMTPALSASWGLIKKRHLYICK